MAQLQSCSPVFLVICLFHIVLIAPSQQQLIAYGTQQFFEYQNQVSVTDLRNLNSKDPISYTLKLTATIRSIWNRESTQLLLITLHKPKLQTSKKEQEVPKIIDKPYYVVVDDGKVIEILADRSRDAYLLNLRRSIASLLNFHYENGPVPEVDVSGECIVFYSAKSSTKYEKLKSDCSGWDLKVSYRSEVPLGVNMKPSLKLEYDLAQDGSLLKVRSHEMHSIALNAKPDAGSQVNSEIILKHVAGSPVTQLKFETLNDTISSLENFRAYELQAEVDGETSEIKGVSLASEISAYKNELTDENIGKEATALLLVKLLPIARITKTEEITEILEANKSLRSQIIDLLGATQTINAHNAFFKVFDINNKENVDKIEKYLQALSVGTHPDRAIIEDLFARVVDGQTDRDSKLADTLIQTTASLARQSTFGQGDELLTKIREYIIDHLTKKCTSIECKTQFIRALQNLQDITTIPELLKVATEGDAKVSVTSLQALRSFPIRYFSSDDSKSFEAIFFQTKKKYDSSSRTLALDIILDMKPNKDQLSELLNYLGSSDRQFEVKTYLLQKLRMISDKCPRFTAMLRACLSEKPAINNYHVLGQKGLTTALHRQLTKSPAFNESLLSIQEINQGVLKRGSVEMILGAGREQISTFKLGLYTSGLNSFVSDSNSDGGDDDEEEDDSPVTAGMEISVQGVLLRPLVFFNGQAELMGHVWSGTASEPTPAFLATTLVQDHEHYVMLSSGSTVYLRVFGAKSIDLNGQVQFSLWNRNAHTEIKQISGTGVVGSMIIGTSFAKLENTFSLTTEPKISLVADIDFYSDMKLCIQLGKPESTLWHRNTKSIVLTNEFPYSKQLISKIEHKLPGNTLALNQKNNEMCNMIYPA